MSINVVSMRLVNGDEIIGRLKDGSTIDNRAFVLERVRHVIVQQVPEGLQTVLMPWSFTNVNGDVTVVQENVLAFLSPDETSTKSYLQQTTTIALTS